MYVFIDESIHSDHDFMLLSFVICQQDPQEELCKILNEFGLLEFHACEKMDGNQLMQHMRKAFIEFIFHNARWGVFILPSNARHKIFHDFSFLIAHIEKLLGDRWLNIFVDEGVAKRSEIFQVKLKNNASKIVISDSSIVKGVQLADLVAALCGVRLREKISGNAKILTYGAESGYEPPIKAELGFELWAKLRYMMCRGDMPIGNSKIEIATFPTIDSGLLLSDQLPERISTIARKTFGQLYLGCIY